MLELQVLNKAGEVVYFEVFFEHERAEALDLYDSLRAAGVESVRIVRLGESGNNSEENQT